MPRGSQDAVFTKRLSQTSEPFIVMSRDAQLFGTDEFARRIIGEKYLVRSGFECFENGAEGPRVRFGMTDLCGVEDRIEVIAQPHMLGFGRDRVCAVGEDSRGKPFRTQLICEIHHPRIHAVRLPCPFLGGCSAAYMVGDSTDPFGAAKPPGRNLLQEGRGKGEALNSAGLDAMMAFDFGHGIRVEVPDDAVEVEEHCRDRGMPGYEALGEFGVLHPVILSRRRS